MKVAVLGAAGGIGQALALLLKTQLPSGSELSLYDIAPVTPGVAVDLSHIPTAVKIKGFQVKMRLRRWKVQMSFLSLQA
ncbi:malate dehydrogenase [Escherichia coli]|nr:malate dehydrogenase [Escherichia coli]